MIVYHSDLQVERLLATDHWLAIITQDAGNGNNEEIS